MVDSPTPIHIHTVHKEWHKQPHAGRQLCNFYEAQVRERAMPFEPSSLGSTVQENKKQIAANCKGNHSRGEFEVTGANRIGFHILYSIAVELGPAFGLRLD